MYRRALLTLVAVAGLVAAGCGAGSPSSPSAGARGVAVQGVVLGDSAALTASSEVHASSAKSGKVTVKVEGTTITAEVSANGTFVLDDIPSGTFTLVFMVDGKEIGRIQVTAQDGDEVKIVVQVKGSSLTLVEMHIEHPESGASPAACVIHGGTQGQGIELEGVVSPGGSWQQFDMNVNGERDSGLVHVSAGTASYKCVGGARVDSDDACKALIAVGGAQVHVRGMLSECTTMEAKVTASEVKIQKN